MKYLPNASQDQSHSYKKRYLLLFLAILLILAISIVTYLFFKYPTTSPINSSSYLVSSISAPHANMTKEITGFLPYWQLDNFKYLHLDLLSEIIFFSLSADKNGQIVKITNNQTDPGWRWWNSSTIKDLIAKTQIAGGKFALTIAMQNNKTLEGFLDNQTAQQTLIDNLLTIVKNNNLDGLNIDFEYDGNPDSSYQQKFTEFAQNLTSQFRSKSPNIELSIDVFPLSIEKPRLYDMAKLAPMFDRVIVMSYDFYAASSDVAGPVAPMTGYKQGKYFFDVITAYQDYLKIVPKQKIIMGIPYYGWDFPVQNGTIAMSKTLPQNDANGYPEVISYGRARSDTDLKPQNCLWDELAQSDWCYYQDPQTQVWHQVWLEDNKSLNIKYDFAKQQDFGGVAIWTLGYDKNYPDLWNMIKTKFTTTK